MKKVMIIFFGIMLLNSIALADSMYCGRNIIRTGYTKAEVYAECGPPAFKEVVGVRERGGFGFRSGVELGEGSPTRWSSTRVVTEEWTYDFGRNRFMKTLVFEGAELKRIKVLKNRR
ncbi:MAG: DUF2845 domain-containing protein [Deltaproteobacteria bacterium]|nr:DUF2845 domain-containing protein [Deltaproteobacteria bacterium]